MMQEIECVAKFPSPSHLGKSDTSNINFACITLELVRDIDQELLTGDSQSVAASSVNQPVSTAAHVSLRRQENSPLVHS